MSLTEKIRDTYRRIREKGERPVWIHLIPEEVSIARAEALGPPRSYLPLYGMTFAIKDNIDLADVPTTAGCPAYAYVPGASATVVERLMAAGAIPIGKTNLDQFATGLVGTRSPYGACSSVFNEKYISGGSSSGSAVAVASGLVDFSLGTDTAGSGRVPASFNGIIGLKPTKGALSTSGVVPACKTQDCVSIFATSLADAARVFEVARGLDPTDGYSRAAGQAKAWARGAFRFGVPRADQLKFFGDESAPQLFREAIAKLESRGGTCVEFDYEPFNDVAHLLYSGPWVAERLAAIQDFAANNAAAMYPVTAKIILNANAITAVSAFKAMYRLADLTKTAAKVWSQMDFMLLPTAGAAYTHDEIAADPIQLNTNLGYYTNFVNLLDLSALSIPAGIRSNGIPFGVTLIAPAWSDDSLLATCGLQTGYCAEGYVPLAVCGAHLTGQPLNFQLKDAGAFLIEATLTSPSYKLYALAGTNPPKPGLVMTESGNGIEVEVWAVPETSFGRFVAAVPPPLAIGTCTLQSGRKVKSFVCEPCALENAEDITALGGWRAYLSQRNQFREP